MGQQPLNSWIETNFEGLLDELLELVRIPSVSAQQEHRSDVLAAAQYIADYLAEAGLQTVEVMPTAGNPVVFGSHHVSDALPTVLIYGHYDVQPPEPLEEWRTPPFEPRVEGGLITARGVSDDKAPLFIALAVTRGFLELDGLPVNVKFLLEGEEEIGSPSLEGFLQDNAELLKADMVLSADGGMWLPDLPTVVNQSRGMVSLEFTLRGARSDLHSGRHGGGITNPLHAMAQLVAGLHDKDGRVTVPGFYDGVQELSAVEREQLHNLPFSDEQYLAEVGAPEVYGEKGYSTLERHWYRPTLELNGMWGGYQGEGSKTVLPAEAHAKITCRLVPGQEPATIAAALQEHLRELKPAGVTLELRPGKHGARAYRVPPEHPGLKLAVNVLRDVFQQEPILVGMGGTLPVSEQFQRILGIDTVFFSFAVGDENIHAPNEFFRVERLRLGMHAWADYLARLAGAWA